LLRAALLLSCLAGCAGGNLSTREKSAGFGTSSGAAVGGTLGGSSAWIGDQQSQETRQAYQQRQIDTTEIERQRREIEKYRLQGEYCVALKRISRTIAESC
jgi:hypothetical protein